MKNTTLIIVVGLFIVLAGGFFFMGTRSASGTTANVVSSDDGQSITLGLKNGNYFPNTITVKSGQPVKLMLDSTVTGCLRSIVISDLNVNAHSTSPNQPIEFTANKKGTFDFRCPMGMGYGKIIVE